jgi:LmbE family N-acetylglucosaminyl deacetylase
MNPYQKFVHGFVDLMNEAKSYPLGTLAPVPRPEVKKGSPEALFFSPHPDDECISGGLALRLLREAGYRVSNVAVTQGSNKARQSERFQELENACRYLGLELIATGPNGLEQINPQNRAQNPDNWAKSVGIIHALLKLRLPRVIIFPHEHDWNSTHIGTHFLLMDALKQMPSDFECYLVETEFWGQMTDPNLMVEISEQDLADMITATTFHVGEVQRNPYHLLLPGWMLDNVRRGAELVGGQGRGVPDFMFAALCRLRRWSNGKAERFYQGGKQVSARTNCSELFP